ncbi:MAG: hypothetical protein M3Y12_13095 [Bacteroidota bacterium]|nr:hypothetical protein [Bacteroidota bacterium]
MKQPLLLLIGAGLLAGCAVTLAPHTPYIPVVRDRGQAEARFSTGLNGTELQLGYQLTEHLVLNTSLLSSRYPGKGNGFRAAELGLGYYYHSPNGFWLLGTHAGLTHGRGASGGNGCFECGSADSLSTSSAFAVGYMYAYVQPTVILLNGNRSWGIGMRVGQTYYHQLNEVRTFSSSGRTQVFDYAGHTSTFIQPTFIMSWQLQRWLALSSSFGIQGFLGPYTRLNSVNPFVVQVGIHLVMNTRPAEHH